MNYVPCPRPGIGKVGKPTLAIGNFYAMRLPDITIYQYDVKISPELDGRDLDKARPVFRRPFFLRPSQPTLSRSGRSSNSSIWLGPMSCSMVEA